MGAAMRYRERTMNEPSKTARMAATALAAFLLLTGASALVYQVLWSKYLALLLGSSAVATVIVLTAFMGGLAIGSWVFGRYADRAPSVLTLYAWLELGVGIYCALFPSILDLLAAPYLRIVAPLHASSPVAFTAARLAFAGLVLVPPTVLMGGTLPAASRFLLSMEAGVRHAVGRLYWINSAGAVVGAVAAGFWLIPHLGLDLTMTAAAGVNVIVGLAAIALRGRLGASAHGRPLEDPSEAPLPAHTAALAVAAITISGFAALALEVAWTRLLALVLGGSTYAFTLMLATFILGIALGSRWVALPRWRTIDPVLLLGGLLCAVALVLAISIPYYERLPYAVGRLSSVFQRTSTAYPLYQAALFGLCLLVMLGPTIAMGGTLPVASRIATRSAAALGGHIGLTYAANTLGTLLGALLAGLVFLPRLGLQSTIALVAMLYGAAAVTALLGCARPARRPALSLGALAVAVFVAVPFLPRWHDVGLAIGLYRDRAVVEIDQRTWSSRLNEEVQLLSHVDGPTATVDVTRIRATGLVALRVNGKPDASNQGDMGTQLLLAHIPALLTREEPRRAAVIGVGSGATIGELLLYPGVVVDAVEIEPAVVSAAREHFRSINRGALEDPRTHLVMEDAKTFFSLSKDRFDLIVSEPSNPWVAGIGGLFTEEYFAQARDRLAPGGLMAQWFHDYEMSDPVARNIVRTFRRVFPDATAWHVSSGDWILVGSTQPLRVDFEVLARRMAQPAIAESLRSIGISSVPGLLALQAMAPAALAAFAGNGVVNSDRFPIIEFAAPQAFFIGATAGALERADERKHLSAPDLFLTRWLKHHPLDAPTALSIAHAVDGRSERVALALHRRARHLSAQEGDAARTLANTLWSKDDQQGARRVLERSSWSGVSDPAILRRLGAIALAECASSYNAFVPAECGEAVAHGERIVALSSPNPAERRQDLLHLGRAYLGAREPRRAEVAFSAALEIPDATARERATLLTGKASASLLSEERTRAIELAREALSTDPTSPDARAFLAAIGP
jgi:predicted membrane-bound spermidine synthase